MTAYIIDALLVPSCVRRDIADFGMLAVSDAGRALGAICAPLPKTEKALEWNHHEVWPGDPLYVQYWRWLVGKEDQTTGKRKGGILSATLVTRASALSRSLTIKRNFPNTLDLSSGRCCRSSGGICWGPNARCIRTR